MIPEGVKFITFNDNYNKVLGPGIIPSTTIGITFGRYYFQCVPIGSLPNGLEKITTLGDACRFNPGSIPASVKTFDYVTNVSYLEESRKILRRVTSLTIYNSLSGVDRLCDIFSQKIFDALYNIPKITIMDQAFTCMIKYIISGHNPTTEYFYSGNRSTICTHTTDYSIASDGKITFTEVHNYKKKNDELQLKIVELETKMKKYSDLEKNIQEFKSLLKLE